MSREIFWKDRTGIVWKDRTDIVWYPIAEEVVSFAEFVYMYLSSINPFDIIFNSSKLGGDSVSSKNPFDITAGSSKLGGDSVSSKKPFDITINSDK